MKKKTHEEYVAELAVKNPTIEVIGKYVDAKTKILHHCLIHDIYWEIAPTNALRGDGCEKCRKDRVRNKMQKTHDEYVKEVMICNPYIEVLEKYIDSRTPILHKCKKHGVEWKAIPSNVLKGHGCAECKSESLKNNFSRTQEQYIYEISIINPNIEVVGMFAGVKVPIMHRCKIHNIEWITSPSSILQGCGCPECCKEKIGDKNRKTHEQYVEELKVKNPNIVALGIYVNALTPILHKCLIDDFEWYARPGNILFGFGCPKCNESKGEKLVRKWLEKNNIKYKYQYSFPDCKDINTLPFDFYLPDYNIAIEYQGKQHYESIDYFGGEKSLQYTQKHDSIKKEYCKNNNIKLLEIPYFKNVEEELNNFLFI